MAYIFHDAGLPGIFFMAFGLPILLGMAVTLILVKKYQSVWRVTLIGNIICEKANADWDAAHNRNK